MLRARVSIRVAVLKQEGNSMRAAAVLPVPQRCLIQNNKHVSRAEEVQVKRKRPP